MGAAVAVKVDNWQQQFELTPPDAGGTAQLQVTSQPSQKVKADGKNVWVGPLMFTISGYMDGTTINVPGSGATTAPGSMPAGSTKVKAEMQPVMLEGDQVQVIVMGTFQAGSSASTVPCPVTVRIKDAGQTKVMAE